MNYKIAARMAEEKPTVLLPPENKAVDRSYSATVPFSSRVIKQMHLLTRTVASAELCCSATATKYNTTEAGTDSQKCLEELQPDLQKAAGIRGRRGCKHL